MCFLLYYLILSETAVQYLPHLETIKDTLDGAALTKDASIRTLEYATEEILNILEFVDKKDNGL